VPIGAFAEPVAFAGIQRGGDQGMHQSVERGVHTLEQLFHGRACLGAVGDAPGPGEGVDGQLTPVAERMVAFGPQQQRVVERVPPRRVEGAQ
jgi:hypothetical protein